MEAPHNHSPDHRKRKSSKSSNAQPEGCALAINSSVRLAAKVGGVLFRISSPLLRQVIAREDRRNRTDRDAGAAVNTFHWVDEELFRLGVICLVLLGMN